MRRRPQEPNNPAVSFDRPFNKHPGDIGIVLSGGGARAAYQVGALRALLPYLKQSPEQISVIIGSSIGAINGLVFAAGLRQGAEQAVDALEAMWRERNFRNTFAGSPSSAFFRAVKVAFLQYMSPGPRASSQSIFDPSPLMQRIDRELSLQGGLVPQERCAHLRAVGVMTTVEGHQRKPLLFASSHKTLTPEELVGASFEVCYTDQLSAKHGFASAALPSVLPPVELDTEHGKVRLVDGGISQNVPVDPAVRFGAHRVLVIDISGRDWWLKRAGEGEDTRPTWEVAAGDETFCLRPPETLVLRCQKPLGPLLKEAVSESRHKFIAAVGPTWPIFTLLKNKLGEDVAYEVMSYVALDTDYVNALLERGYSETRQILQREKGLAFHSVDSFAQVKKVQA